MADTQATLWLALLWLVREIAGITIKHSASRRGRIGCNPDKCGFYELIKTEEGKEILAQFPPQDLPHAKEMVPLTITANLFNDTDTAVLLKGFRLEFWGVDGLRGTHTNPEVRCGDNAVNVLRLPAHDVMFISMVPLLPLSGLSAKYAETLPLLQATDVNGRKYSFRVGRSSFYGERLVVWPSAGGTYPTKYPIYSELALNRTYTLVERVMIDWGLRSPKSKAKNGAVGKSEAGP